MPPTSTTTDAALHRLDLRFARKVLDQKVQPIAALLPKNAITTLASATRPCHNFELDLLDV